MILLGITLSLRDYSRKCQSPKPSGHGDESETQTRSVIVSQRSTELYTTGQKSYQNFAPVIW